MTNYTEMTPKERFAIVDRMASQLTGSNRWKSAIARKYGMTPQGIDLWRTKGAPVWACEALQDALSAKNWSQVRAMVEAINDADDDGCPPA